MNRPIKSTGLAANLKLTQLPKDLVLREEHQWLLSLSESHYGIHERTKNFFDEYYHVYINWDHVSDELRRLALGDFWFYTQCSDQARALDIILRLFEESLEKTVQTKAFEMVFMALVEFLAMITKLETFQMELESKGLDIIKRWVEQSEVSVLRNATFVKKQLSVLNDNPELKDKFFEVIHLLAGRVIWYWAENSCAETWYEKNKDLFSEDFADELSFIGKPYFDDLLEKWHKANTFEELDNTIPLYSEITKYFIGRTDTFLIITNRFYYLVYLLHIPTMSHVTNTLLINLNILIKKILEKIEPEQVKPFIDNIFKLFHELQKEHSSTVLECISTLGKEIVNSSKVENTKDFVNKIIELPFVTPGPLHMSQEWRTEVDPSHIKNIRVWLSLFETKPELYHKLILALTVNLKLKGIFIFDTDLFQKDISALLNSDFHPYFRTVKQLCRIFPVYFNEIGAEGELRDITTAIDEMTHRDDKLIHFLRKLVHIESNNTHISFTKKVFNYWIDGNLQPLEPYLPEDVKAAIDPKWASSMQKIILKTAEKAHLKPSQLIDEHPDKVDKWVDSVNDHSQTNKKRLKMLCRIYFILIEKYSFNTVNLGRSIRKHNFIAENEIVLLEDAIQKKNREEALKLIFHFISLLKEIILSKEKTEGWENIYHKRHVAFGIPSMYGDYHERRFEAGGLIFKLEQAAHLIMEEWVKSINLNYITAKILVKIDAILAIYKEGLELDGITNDVFISNMGMFSNSLKSQSFSLHQYINIFEFMSENIREIISKYFFSPYEDILKIVIPGMREGHPDPGPSANSFFHMQSETFYRDMLSSSFLLQSLDNFITEILTSLRNMVETLSAERIRDIMSYNPDMVISPLYGEATVVDNQVFIGSKAYFLKKLKALQYPVPPGFVITTEVFRRKNTILQHKMLSREIDTMIQAQIRRLEKETRLELGNPKKPLMLSVRSGTAVSMPGAMNTFLNIGINEVIIEELSKQPNYGWTSWDCYRRFLQSWGMASGISRDTFDQIMMDFKKADKVDLKVQFKPHRMRDMAFAYREILDKNNIHVEEDMFLQVKQAILSVFDSWNSSRAKVYRHHLRIADEWGTAVIVQKMVLGNINYTSGTGVFFTNNPHKREPGIHLYGDYSLVSQGEDVVGGLVHVLPISQDQPHIQGREKSLQEAFPRLYERLYNIAKELVEMHGFSHQEIEFTFESDNPDDLYILQTRDQNTRPKNKKQMFAISDENMILLGQGVGIGGGAINGILVFDDKGLKEMRQEQPDKKLILVRPDTVPDDIDLIFRCDGLLTSRGGATSHAAVTAARLGKICIVNCTELVVNERESKCTIKGHTLSAGDKIAIDGNLGNIYLGHYHMMINE